MIERHPLTLHFSEVVKLVIITSLSLIFTTEARAADWRVLGVYAYEKPYWDTNGRDFPLVVFRYYTGQPVEPQVAEIRQLAKKGHGVIVNFEFMKDIQQRRSIKTLPPIDAIKSKMLAMLDGLEDIRIEAISIDEENSLSESKIQYLNALYQTGKRHSPHQRFVQWVVFRKKGGQVQFGGVASIKTDGWIIDPYLSSDKDYEAIVETLRDTSKPIYSVVWAAPGWNVGAGYRVSAKPHWWNDSQWRIFYNRLAVNQKNNVSTIFYLYGLEKKNVRSLWAGNRCDRRFYLSLVNITLPYYRKNRISSTPPAQRPEWIPAYCE